MTKDWVHGIGHSPVCQILLQIVVRTLITSSPPAWTSSAGMLSTPADFPFFNDCTAASTFLRKMGWSSSVSVWVQFSTDDSPLALWLHSSEQYSVHRFSIYRSSVRHFPHRQANIYIYIKSNTTEILWLFKGHTLFIQDLPQMEEMEVWEG